MKTKGPVLIEDPELCWHTDTVHEQKTGGYSDCRYPALCTYCGGNCPYGTDSVDKQLSKGR